MSALEPQYFSSQVVQTLFQQRKTIEKIESNEQRSDEIKGQLKMRLADPRKFLENLLDYDNRDIIEVLPQAITTSRSSESRATPRQQEASNLVLVLVFVFLILAIEKFYLNTRKSNLEKYCTWLNKQSRDAPRNNEGTSDEQHPPHTLLSA